MRRRSRSPRRVEPSRAPHLGPAPPAGPPPAHRYRERLVGQSLTWLYLRTSTTIQVLAQFGASQHACSRDLIAVATDQASRVSHPDYRVLPEVQLSVESDLEETEDEPDWDPDYEEAR